MTLLSLVLNVNIANASPDVRIPLSATGGVRVEYNENSSLLGFLFNFQKKISDGLTYEDQIEHTRAIIFAASTLETGEIVQWYNQQTETGAQIKIVHSRPAQGGVCRMMYIQVEQGKRVQEYTEYACKTIDNKYWTFSAR